ncbi:hypothetical protein LEMLEM_LOCUS18623, partial [Lemmus lemmus]
PRTGNKLLGAEKAPSYFHPRGQSSRCCVQHLELVIESFPYARCCPGP